MIWVVVWGKNRQGKNALWAEGDEEGGDVREEVDGLLDQAGGEEVGELVVCL